MKNVWLISGYFLSISLSQSCNRADPQHVETAVSSTTIEGKVVAIKDGDTFVILQDREQITVRLSDIDCPEKKQPFGNKAKQFASDLCFGKDVTVQKKARNDRYGRVIGEVFVAGVSVNKEMVKNGMAWHFTRYSSDKSFADLERSAREQKLGLWIENNATPPWEWRVPKKSTR